MKAIVVTDRAAGTAGMTLTERPVPLAAINDVIVQIHASGFVATELEWPSTWTDRADRDRTPSIPGHELAGVVTGLGYGDDAGCRWDSGCSASRTGIGTARWRSTWQSRRATSRTAVAALNSAERRKGKTIISVRS